MKAITVEPKKPGSARYGEFPGPDVHQGTSTINLLRIDPKSGRLTPTDRSLTVVSPVCVRFVPFEGAGDMTREGEQSMKTATACSTARCRTRRPYSCGRAA